MVLIRDIAKYFISISEENSIYAITPLKLQKLLYYAQGYHYINKGEPLFAEDLVAWDHGPVNTEIYDEYKKFKYFTIPKDGVVQSTSNSINEEAISTIEMVWNKYGHLDGKTLEELTHQEDPWLDTRRNAVIKKEKIRDYFLEEVN